MFEDINRELRECKDNILLKETLEEKLVTLEDTYYRKNKVLEGLEEKLNKEFKDVEKFNKISVANIISTIFNYREEKLYKVVVCTSCNRHCNCIIHISHLFQHRIQLYKQKPD